MNPQITWPVKGRYPITFRFGEAPEWYTKIFGYPHNGLDIACPIGTAILATDRGMMYFADDIPDGDGKGVILLHEWGQSLYWHLSAISAKVGQTLQKGQYIGCSGNTGYTTGPHLHFGVKVAGVDIAGMRGWANPEKYISDQVVLPEEPIPAPKTYIIRIGDTLYGIAQKFYNNGTEWRRIYDANKDKIKNPNLIYPFQKIIIP